MSIETFNDNIFEFIQQHVNEDPADLMLKAHKWPDMPMKDIAEQITSRQRVSDKLPDWVSNKRIIFPPRQNLEQSSSQLTAIFKSKQVKGSRLLDLTGGTGVDLFYMSQNFEESVYTEPDKMLCDLAKYNFDVLDREVEVVNSTAEDFIHKSKREFDVIYLDPSRRDNRNNRVTGLMEYQPDVTEIYQDLLSKGKKIIIKISPMADIKRILKLLPDTYKVQVVAVQNEVKELLYYLSEENDAEPEIEAWNISAETEELFSFKFSEESKARAEIGEPKKYIYDLNSPIRKAGAFKIVSERFGIKKLGANTHLYTSDSKIDEFPGRIFEVLETLSPTKNEINRQFKKGVVNVITRNFPIKTNELKKKFKLQDGGEDFLIFCEISGHQKIALRCKMV